MKKALIYSLSLALLLSLTACHKPQADQQDTSQPDPAATSPPADISTPEPEKSTSPEQLSNKQLPEISHDELLEVFEEQYAILQSVDDSDSEDTIQNELFTIQFMIEESMEKSLPSDYEQQYRAWRAAYEDDDDDEAARIEAEIKDMINQSRYPEPDQELIDAGFVATRDPSSPTGWSYENPNVVDDPYSSSLTNGSDANKGMITDPSQLDTGVKDPYLGSDSVTIGYGEDIGSNDSGNGDIGSWSTYKPGGVKEVDEN